MFCHKCGNEVSDGAVFCHKCGTKMESVDTTPQSKDISATTSRPRTVSTATTPIPPPAQNIQVDTPKKKKTMKLPIILGAVALVIVAIIVIAMNWNGKIDYEATVRAYTPYANSQGLPYNCGEVFDKYIPDARWEVRKAGDVAYVDISGTAKGTERKLIVTIKVVEDPSDPDIVNFTPEIISVDDEKAPASSDVEDFLFAMFWMYDKKYDDITELLSEASTPFKAEALPNKTQSYDNSFGNMEVTLDYVEFVDMLTDTQTGEDIYPEDDSVFLRAAVTVENIGTEKGGLCTGWNRLIYDNKYEFAEDYHPTKDDLTNIKPLSPPKKGAIIFTVPKDVVESDKSLVLNINDIDGTPAITYVLRPAGGTITAANTSGESGTANSYPNVISYKGISIGYLLESTDDVISLLGDSPLNDELKLRYDDMEFYHDNGAITSLESFDPSLFEADGMPLNKNRDGLIAIFGQPLEEGNDGGGYFMSYDLPDCSLYFELGGPDSEAWRVSISPSASTKSISGEMLSNGEPISARDFVGTYSYDASFEDPTGKWNNFYYLLEIGLDGSALVVTQTWRGNYLFDHARVSPIDVTGNTLVFDASVVGSTEPEIHSLTYTPAKDSPLGIDTIYIDDDDAMPFVRE